MWNLSSVVSLHNMLFWFVCWLWNWQYPIVVLCAEYKNSQSNKKQIGRPLPVLASIPYLEIAVLLNLTPCEHLCSTVRVLATSWALTVYISYVCPLSLYLSPSHSQFSTCQKKKIQWDCHTSVNPPISRSLVLSIVPSSASRSHLLIMCPVFIYTCRWWWL